jgi:LuxR family transcriptional regulator/LuxR family quorum-sensing system transcriptional regulator CciR
MSDLEDYIAGIASAETPLSMWDVVLPYVRKFGIDRVSYHHVQGLGGAGEIRTDVVARGFPERWVCDYVGEKLYLVDPIPDFAMRAMRPFLWSSIADLAPLSPEARTYLDRLAKENLGDGLALQVFGPHMRNGYVGLGFAPQADMLGSAELHQLQCAAQFAHLRYCELVPAHRDSDLTQREQEVLGWIARGKSNSVIAEILGVSPHTIDTLVRRIYAKLEVSDRTTAAIKGVGAGLISLDGRSVA